MALTAIAHEEFHETRKRGQRGAVDDRPTLTAGLDKPRLFEMAQVKQHTRRRRPVHRFADGASGNLDGLIEQCLVIGVGSIKEGYGGE